MDILRPPQSWIDYKCAVHGKQDEYKAKAIRKFFDTFPSCREEVRAFGEWRYDQVQKKGLPVEHIDVRHRDGSRSGNVRRMMIVDIDYWLDSGMVRQQKVYMPLDADYWLEDWTWPEWLVKNVNQAKRPGKRPLVPVVKSAVRQIDHKAQASGSEEEVPF